MVSCVGDSVDPSSTKTVRLKVEVVEGHSLSKISSILLMVRPEDDWMEEESGAAFYSEEKATSVVRSRLGSEEKATALLW